MTGAKPESRGASAALTLAHVMAGGVVSCTVTVKLHWLVLPPTSVAVQVTVFTPRLKSDPLGGVQAAVAPGQLSAMRGAKETDVPNSPAHSATMLFGQL